MRNTCRYFLVLFITLLTCSVSASANSFSNTDPSLLPWSLEMGLGYTHIQDMYKSDGNTPIGRFGIAKELINYSVFHGGVELGIQSGNSSRPSVPQNILDQLGGLQIDSTIKPMLDLLLTARLYPSCDSSFFGLLKLGAAYRMWQFTRTTVSDIREIDPELQIGVGMDMNQLFRMSLAYQRIFGENAKFNMSCPTCTTRIWGGIPSQNSVILGVTVLLDR
jgi:hypothetical protein